jgi:hypothetical protein
MKTALARPLGLASLAGLLLAAGGASSGCVGRRYVEETLYGPGRQPQVHTEPMVVPDVRAESFSDVQMANAPLGVQAAFQRAHHGAAVTRVDQYPAGGGYLLYRVSYLEDGVPGTDVYRPGGEPVYEPEMVWVGPRGGDDLGYRPSRPTTRPSPRDVQ